MNLIYSVIGPTNQGVVKLLTLKLISAAFFKCVLMCIYLVYGIKWPTLQTRQDALRIVHIIKP